MSEFDRRAVIASAAGAVLTTATTIGWSLNSEPARAAEPARSLVCRIQQVVDPAKAAAFAAYARQWGIGAARCGGRLLGMFAPHEGGETAIILVAFANLADYEIFEARIAADPDAVAAGNLARAHRLILNESRTFSRRVS